MFQDFRLGLDFGGVIVNASKGGNMFDLKNPKSNFKDQAVDSIRRLNELLYGNVWVISKASGRTIGLTRQLLEYSQFYKNTGFYPSNLIFCAKRYDKVEICKRLKISLFVDDNLDTVEMLRSSGINALYFQAEQSVDLGNHVSDWGRLESHVREAVSR